MWQLVILSVEYYENVSMVMYLQLNFDGTSRISYRVNCTIHMNKWELKYWVIHYNRNFTLYLNYSIIAMGFNIDNENDDAIIAKHISVAISV